MSSDPTQPDDTAAHAGTLAPGTQLLEYEIESVLGQGGFGITYLAHDTHLQARFAIKEYLPPELAVRGRDNSVTVRSQESRGYFDYAKDKFLQEARVLARFSHPNIVRVLRFFEAHGTVYFVMDFVEGQTLSQSLPGGARMGQDEVLAILLPIIDGLRAVHAAEILHRDIKPGNIIQRPDGTPVLIDFGAARRDFGSVSRSLMNVASAGYSAIEQYSEDMDQGPWTDIYALGAVAYRLITGRRLPDSLSRLKERGGALASHPELEGFDEHVLLALDWALAVHPDSRPQSLERWQEALDGKLEPPRPAAAGPALKATLSDEVVTSVNPEAPTTSAELDAPTQLAPGADAPTAATVALSPTPPSEAQTQIIAPDKALRGPDWRRMAAGASALILVASLIWIARPLADPEPAPASTAADAQAPAVAPPAASPTTRGERDFRDKAEAMLEDGQHEELAQLIEARLVAEPESPLALALSAHLHFRQGDLAQGAADYATALSARPELAERPRIAADLVHGLGRVTAAVEAQIRAHPTPTVLAALAQRSGEAGRHGRGHAVRLLTELGSPHLIDRFKNAKLDLVEQEDCALRAEAARTLGEVGDPTVIPLLKEQVPGWFGMRCLRGAVNDAVSAIEARHPGG